jgi:4-amino-4-deoxy-L-arabinose transferase-like glycosyltransferase
VSAPEAGRRALTAVLALFLVALTFVAITVPFHATDALIYGRWSRLIELEGGLHFPGIGSGFLHRPLVYVVQGWLWDLFGFHEWIGRLWSLTFVLLLVWAVWRLAALDRGGALVGALAAVALVASPDVVALGAAGLTDVPVAALVALAGLLALAPSAPRPRFRRAAAGPEPDAGDDVLRAASLAAAAALAALAKPSAFIALVGIGLALLVGPRARLWRRVLWRGVPLAAGTLVALVWDAVQAHRIGTSLTHFVQGADTTLSTGVIDYYHQLSAQSRGSFIFAMEWLGPYLVLPLLFALIYAIARVAGRPHRWSATLAAPAALLLSIVLPMAASGAAGPYSLHRPVAVLGTLALIVPLWWSRDCPEADAPTRAHLARMLLWAAPPTLAWIVSAPFQTRYLSPAWAPIYVLVGAGLWIALRGTAERRRELGWIVVGVLCLIALFDLRNLDGLGSRPDGSINALRAVRALGVSGWLHPNEARAGADPSLAAIHDATAAALRTPGRLITVDGRLAFYWPLRTTRGEPQRCAELRGFSTLVVAESATGLDAAREKQLTPAELAQVTGGHAADPTFWRGCRDPGVRERASVPGQFAVFRVLP